MKHVFGPVPSRRLGQSLGIDPVPLKTCNWNCVYCQLGRSIPLINERREYIPKETIYEEIVETLQSPHTGKIDWITFVGSGETTLHSKLGWLIKKTKELTDIPVAVITNGSLLYLPEVRQELLPADAIMPTVDAGTPDLYKKINRPHPEATFERLIDGLIQFRKEYTGKLWVEVMLVSGLNDSEDALNQTAKKLREIAPDEIHINLPTRPPVEKWVKPPEEKNIQLAQEIFGRVAKVVRPQKGSFVLSENLSLEDAVLNIITRHPMRHEELIETLKAWAPHEVSQTLEDLLASGKAQIVIRNNVKYWSASDAYYPD